MSLDYSRCPLADQIDEAKKARTEQLFELMRWGQAKDSELLALVQQGICLEARDYASRTALMQAAAWGTATLRPLIAAGADVEARDNMGMTALMLSASNVRHSTRELIAAGADIEARDDNGKTALMLAAWNGKDSIVQELIDFGANVYARSNYNQRLIDRLISDQLKEGEAAYADFAANHTAPQTKQELYQLLAFTPLVDEYEPVDYVGNLRKICVNANWKDKEQAEALLEELQVDGVINASDVSDILQQTFPLTNRLLASPSSRRGR